jgi:hypothetical protein
MITTRTFFTDGVCVVEVASCGKEGGVPIMMQRLMREKYLPLIKFQTLVRYSQPEAGTKKRDAREN